ncbi:hypothetical protein T07_9422 [Trichinella nelsoni]|uniref:Secreted protein n=1 Tax=Trichinella nelsoni TaxID=6336 RepID=A0A0V0SIE3_9BILA|nr:hypothetical protein T07_9422 [Trichinella nelsoni]
MSCLCNRLICVAPVIGTAALSVTEPRGCDRLVISVWFIKVTFHNVFLSAILVGIAKHNQSGRGLKRTATVFNEITLSVTNEIASSTINMSFVDNPQLVGY